MKKTGISIFVLLLSIILVACSSYGDTKSYAPDSGGESGEPGGQGSSTEIQAGQLTAAEWNDQRNFGFYQSLFVDNQGNKDGAFLPFANHPYFDTHQMIEVRVESGTEKVLGAKVELLKAEKLIYSAISDVFGLSYLYPSKDDINEALVIRVTNQGEVINQPYTFSNLERSVTINLENYTAVENHLIEIMFVIDTTGSMGDELNYLKAEVDDVITRIKEEIPEATIQLALLFYRDLSDAYVTRYFEFTTDIELQKQNLQKQTASGGGDFPEAVDRALDEAVNKQWTDQYSTKLIFHLLDAPPHNTQEKMTNYHNAIYQAAVKGIKIIPVAASGIDYETEFLLRNQAMMTNGTFVFLTNDSGIGHEKIEPNTGDVVVEYLNHLLVRLVITYHTGVEVDKIPYYDQQ